MEQSHARISRRSSDAAAWDCYVNFGYTYDYYFKRFGRHGLDNANVPILSLVHPANRSDLFGNLDLYGEVLAKQQRRATPIRS